MFLSLQSYDQTIKIKKKKKEEYFLTKLKLSTR